MSRDPSLKLAAGEFRDHKYTYLAIIIIVALSMTVYTTQSSMNQYNEYTTWRSVGMFYGDGIITNSGTTVRNILSGASAMGDAADMVSRVNAMPGFKATPRAESEGSTRTEYWVDAMTAWGADLETDELVCEVKDKIIAGEYFDPSITYTQIGMGNPLGTTVMFSPTFSFGIIPIEVTRNNMTILPYPVIVGKTAAEINHWKVGSIFVSGMLTDQAAIYCDAFFEVIGIYETDKPLIETLFYVLPIESIREIKGWGESEANYICIRAPEGMSDSEVRNALAPVIGDKVFYSRSDLKAAVEGNLNAIGQTILYTTIGASLLLAAAAVKFVMDSIIIRKSREIGTLKALGARDRTVVKIFLYQAFFIGAISGGLGLLISLALMNLLSTYGLSLDYSLGAQMNIKFILSEFTAITALGLPIVVSILAAILPCKRVAKLSPVEAIRRGDLQGSKDKARNGLLEKLDRILPRFKRRLSPLSMAIDEMRDHFAIYAIVVIVIAIALSVFTLQSSYKQNLEDTVSSTMQDTICSDGMVVAPDMTARSMMGGGAKIADAVGLAEQIQSKTGYVAVPRSNKQAVVVLGNETDPIYEGGSIWGIDVKRDEDVFNLSSKLIEGQYFNKNEDYSQWVIGEFFQMIPALKLSGLSTTVLNEMLQEPYPAIVGKSFANAHDIGVGDQYSILVTGSDKGTGLVSAPFVVIGIYETGFEITDSLLQFVPREAVNQMMGYGDNDGNAVIVKAPEGLDYREIYQNIKSAAPDYEAFSWHEAVTFMIGPAFDAMMLIVYTAIVITLALGAFIIKYAMDTTVSRKTREIRTLKAFGMRDRTVVEIFIWQGALIGILSGLFGILLSTGLAYVVVNVLKITAKMPMGMVLKVGFTITGPILAVTLIAPFITAILASIIPSKRAARLSPVEAIRKGELNQ